MRMEDRAGLGCLGIVIASVLLIVGLVTLWFNPAAGVTIITAAVAIAIVSVITVNF
jgi:hypothetical protein